MLDSKTVRHIYYNVFLDDKVINLFFYKCVDILFMLEKIQTTTKIDRDFWISAEDFLMRVKTKYSPSDIQRIIQIYAAAGEGTISFWQDIE